MERYFATVAPGLEAIAGEELTQLGASSVQTGFSGVSFQGDRALLYRVNLWGRTLFRVLVPLTEFSCTSPKQLYQDVRSLPWDQYLTPEQTLAVDCTGKNRALNHTHFTALQVKNAIVDQQRQQFGARSSVEVDHPDVRVNLHIYRDRATLSLDSSGSSLHRRGYRAAVGTAPLKETLAAAILKLARYSPELPFLDPLCGSGTLALEAALQAANIAPGLFRERFGFENWPDFDATLWQNLKDEAQSARLATCPAYIGGSDVDDEVLEQARQNAAAAGVLSQIEFRCRDIRDIEAPSDRGVLICNPPYGERLGEVQELRSFYRLLGDIFKQRFKGWTAYVFTGNRELAKEVGLRPARRIPLSSGGLDCRLLEFELY